MTDLQSTPQPQPNVDWHWKAFDDLTTAEVYDMLAARSAVFVVEQNCVYGDVDGLDTEAWHLFAYDRSRATDNGRQKLAGYLRVLLPGQPGQPENEPATDIRIGRVLTTADFRGVGLGSAMLEQALGHILAQWPGVPVRLHAQAHLQGFYAAFGFETISDIHDDDGIPHVWMRSV